ncbi:MAG TPA: VOC family protein [Thermoanaerobaculia bacterium]|jgi:catechol 2,3-dioxygenase-like lactoylglutathione lyase family enzyme
MTQKIGSIALVVRDYDEAIAYYTRALGFRLVEDTPLAGGKRWVLVAPPGALRGLCRGHGGLSGRGTLVVDERHRGPRDPARRLRAPDLDSRISQSTRRRHLKVGSRRIPASWGRSAAVGAGMTRGHRPPRELRGGGAEGCGGAGPGGAPKP